MLYSHNSIVFFRTTTESFLCFLFMRFYLFLRKGPDPKRLPLNPDVSGILQINRDGLSIISSRRQPMGAILNNVDHYRIQFRNARKHGILLFIQQFIVHHISAFIQHQIIDLNIVNILRQIPIQCRR